MQTKTIVRWWALAAWCSMASPAMSQMQQIGLQNEPIDLSKEFYSFTHTYFLADSLAQFDAATGTGILVYRRHEYSTRMAFNNMLGVLKPVGPNEFPTAEYAVHPALPFQIEFTNERTLRIMASSGNRALTRDTSLMLIDGLAPRMKEGWNYQAIPGGHRFTGVAGSVEIVTCPFKIKLYDAQHKLLTETVHLNDVRESTYTPVLPFAFVRKANDYSRQFNACFRLSPDEKIFGCGESFTRLDKRGQKLVLWTDDANGIENETLYKPIPFYFTNRGYGVFMHTSAPVTCDFGKYYTEATQLMIGDSQLDLFLFLGNPKEILNAYTALTGKASMPPLWSFGLWMSRISYFSEADGRNVAKQLRAHQIPSDVIHFDTGWFETDWRCDYRFASSRFADAKQMMADLRKEGLRICLWQLPYFVPQNTLYSEIVRKKLYIKDGKGELPYEDAVLDFSNPETVKWYQEKIAGLLKLGVGAIKVDFGEAAPASGVYASGKTGWYEHNLYPLRYNQTVAHITQQTTGEHIIWARSAWAGSQRYPLHWGGDAANTYNAMEAQLRGGLSLGLSGFTFWSHDIGGFVLPTPEKLYDRWLPFGMLTTHSRCHGAPPKEPWAYGEAFTNRFRKAVELKYRLMPYIYAQSMESARQGLPMMRALFVEYPNDPGAWLIDNQYLFGSDLLVAPLFDETTTSRQVYLPGGKWIDYQSGKVYNPGWHQIEGGEIPVVLLVRDGAALAQATLAQSTDGIDWRTLELKVFAAEATQATAWIATPRTLQAIAVTLQKEGNRFVLPRQLPKSCPGLQVTLAP